MVEKFHDELREAKKDVIKMGYLSKDMLQKSVKALKDQDVELANWVLSNKGKLANMDDDIEDRTLETFSGGLFAPSKYDAMPAKWIKTSRLSTSAVVLQLN